MLKILAWLCLAVILFLTLSPIGLRPHDPLPVNIDRALAFCVMAGLFVAAYPRQWPAVLMLSLCGAGMIELLQFLSPTRHAQLPDALVKASGAIAGVALGALFNRLTGRDRTPPGLVIISIPQRGDGDDGDRR